MQQTSVEDTGCTVRSKDMRAFRIGRIPTEIFCELVTVVAIIRPTGADEYVFLLELQDADPDKWWRMLKDQ